jgi:SRSO17 transposase
MASCLAQAQLQDVGKVYGMRMWIEYGFKQSKQELGWSDFRVTSYPDIEKWWEMVSSAYLMVSLQAEVFTAKQQAAMAQEALETEMQAPAGQDDPGSEKTTFHRI